jgi:hypothetical protein
MIAAAALALVSSLLVPATAGTSGERPRIALTASPAQVSLDGSERATVRVVNSGAGPVVVDVSRAGFSLDLRGRPRIARRGDGRTAAAWLKLQPRTLALAPGEGRYLTVSSRLPAAAEPGDHDALVLLTTRPRRALGVAVRMRVGVVVVVRAPGRIVRRIGLRSVRVRRRGRRVSALELWLVNRGNVTEALDRSRIDVRLRRGRRTARLLPVPRELRPRTSGLMLLPYRGRLRGWVTARVTISLGPRAAVRRTFRLRL